MPTRGPSYIGASTPATSDTLGALAGVLAGVVWLVLTPFMATTWNCYGVCTEWGGQPLVVRTVGRWLAGLGAFSPPVTSDPYFDYGRFFPLFYLLAIVTLRAFHRAQARRASALRPLARWSFRAALAALVVGGLGDLAGYVVGRYVTAVWSAGWAVEALSWLLAVPALITYGAATLRQAAMPRWTGWALVVAGAGLVVFSFDFWLVAYMPNSPLLPLAATCSALGGHLAACRAGGTAPVGGGRSVGAAASEGGAAEPAGPGAAQPGGTY